MHATLQPPPSVHISPPYPDVAWSSTEFDDEAFVRRRTNVKEITFPTWNGIQKMREWLTEATSMVVAASNRRDSRTRSWFNKVLIALSVEELEVYQKRWSPLEDAIASANLQVARGATKR